MESEEIFVPKVKAPPYPLYNCEFRVQLYGSTWKVIMRGSTENITLAFNGIYNFMGCGGEIEFADQTETVATFWSSEHQMRKFFSLLYFFRTPDRRFARYKGNKDGNPYKARMLAFVNEQIALLRETSETFTPYRKRDYNPLFELSTDTAEKPDDDFKDAVLQHAFQDRGNVGEVEKMLQHGS